MLVCCARCHECFPSEEEADAHHKRRRVQKTGLLRCSGRDLDLDLLPVTTTCAGSGTDFAPVTRRAGGAWDAVNVLQHGTADPTYDGGDGRTESELKSIQTMVHSEYKSRDVLPQHKLHPNQQIGDEPVLHDEREFTDRERAFATVRKRCGYMPLVYTFKVYRVMYRSFVFFQTLHDLSAKGGDTLLKNADPYGTPECDQLRFKSMGEYDAVTSSVRVVL